MNTGPLKHSNTARHRLAAALIATLALTASPLAAPAPDAGQIRGKEAELEKLRRVIEETDTQLNALRGRHGRLRAQLRSTERDIGELNTALRDLERQRVEHTESLARLQQDKKRKEAGLTQQRDALAEHLRASYALGKQGPLKLLLNQTEPAAAGRSLKYYDYFYRARTEQIDSINRNLLAVARLEQDIQSQARELDALLARQQQQKATLEDKRQARKTLLAELENEISGSEQRLSKLKEDEQGLQELVRRLRRALADMPPPAVTGKNFAQLKGKLSLPAEGKIAARFGGARQLGHLKWQGIVIDTPDGTQVRAIAPGRVVFADWMRGFGLLLIVDHGEGYMSLYGNNQSLEKSVGETVAARELIAHAGNSGGRERTGLYFEIREKGAPVNPLHWCKTGNDR